MSNVFNLSEVIVTSELTGKIDPNKWINKANIVTPDFRKLDPLHSLPDAHSSYWHIISQKEEEKNPLDEPDEIECIDDYTFLKRHFPYE